MPFSKQRRPISSPSFFLFFFSPDVSPNTNVSAWWASAEHGGNCTSCYLYTRRSWTLISSESRMEIHFKCYKDDSSKQVSDAKRKVEGEDILGVLIKFGLWPQAHTTA